MLVFFFSSRRRHTRFDCDWSSDVCSSDLPRFHLTRMKKDDGARYFGPFAHSGSLRATLDWLHRKLGRSEERREGKSVDLGGRRIIKKKKQQKHESTVYCEISKHGIREDRS